MLLNKMQHIQFLVMACLAALGSSQLGQADVSMGDTISVTPTLTSFLTSTVTHTPSSRVAEPLVDGRCYWDRGVQRWTWKRKGFACTTDFMCVDLRTELQKQADRQEAADGKNGGCLFSFESRTFGCPQKGFECEDEVLCVDKRTVREMIEDELEEEMKKRASRKLYVANTIVGGTFAGIAGLLIWCCCCCGCCDDERDAKRDAKMARKQQARDAEKAKKERNIALQEIEKAKAKEERRQAKRDREVEDAVVKAIQKSEAGSQEQRDWIAVWETIRAVKVQGDARTEAPQACGSQPRDDGNEGTNKGGGGPDNGHNAEEELPPYSVESVGSVERHLD
jgi:hypothetical protein